jgi:starvation-inducible outer membrane lipoprotein
LWCGANVDGKKKSDQEAKKRQRIRIGGKVILVANAEFEIR